MAFLNRFPLARVAAAVALALVVRTPARGQQSAEGEYAIKAAFLYNFTKFVEWPSTAAEGASGPFRVCVFAGQPFVRQLEATLQGETVRGRPIQLESGATNAVRTCHLVYFDAAHTENAARLVPALRQMAVLTVGEGERFLRSGGAVAFTLERDRVRFDVSMPAVEAAGLTVSSKLLRVARHVEGRKPR